MAKGRTERTNGTHKKEKEGIREKQQERKAKMTKTNVKIINRNNGLLITLTNAMKCSFNHI